MALTPLPILIKLLIIYQASRLVRMILQARKLEMQAEDRCLTMMETSSLLQALRFKRSILKAITIMDLAMWLHSMARHKLAKAIFTLGTPH